MQTKNAITSCKINVDQVTMKYINRQSLLNAALSHSENKSVTALRANVSWEKRPTLARGIIMTLNSKGPIEKHTEHSLSGNQPKCISLRKNILDKNLWTCLPVRVAALHRAPPS